MLHDEETVDDEQMDEGNNQSIMDSDTETSQASTKTDTVVATGSTTRCTADGDDVPNVLESSSIDWKTVDLNAQNKRGNTALHIAVISCDIEAVKLLLSRGADPYARNHKGETPLHKAIRGEADWNESPDDSDPFLTIINILLDELQDVNVKDNKGRTPVHYAAMLWKYPVINLLFDHDPDVNIISVKGTTALDEARHYAVTSGFALLHNLVDRVSEMDDLFANDSIKCFRDQFVFQTKQMDVQMILEDYIIKILALGRYVSEKNITDVDIAKRRKCLYDECKEEVEFMMGEKIGHSTISFYEYLMKSIHQCAITLSNRDIKATLEKAEYQYHFEIYSNFIRSRFERAKKRNDLLDASLISMNHLSGRVLMDYPSMEIVSYLSNRDLKNLIKASALATQDAASKLKKDEITNADNASHRSRGKFYGSQKSRGIKKSRR